MEALEKEKISLESIGILLDNGISALEDLKQLLYSNCKLAAKLSRDQYDKVMKIARKNFPSIPGLRVHITFGFHCSIFFIFGTVKQPSYLRTKMPSNLKNSI